MGRGAFLPLLSTWTGGGYVECPHLSIRGGRGSKLVHVVVEWPQRIKYSWGSVVGKRGKVTYTFELKLWSSLTHTVLKICGVCHMCLKSNFNPKFHDFRWIEKWLRRWRNVYCGHSAQIGPSGIKTLTGPCQSTVRHLRSAQCSGSSRKSVLQSLQTDLECDAFNGSSSKLFKRSWWLLLMSLILFVQAFIQWLSPYSMLIRYR